MMPAYPLALSNDGGLAISTDNDRDNVIALLSTNFYERCMFPNYGLPLYAFDPVSSQDAHNYLLAIQLAIDVWHDFLATVSVDLEQLDSGTLNIWIQLGNQLLGVEL